MTETEHTQTPAKHNHHVRSLIVVYIWLMILLVLTVAASFPDLGTMNIVIALTIALIKATLVVLIFMHVLHSDRLVWIFSSAAFVWLAIMLALTFNDYATRGRIPRGRMMESESASVRPPPHHAQAGPRG